MSLTPTRTITLTKAKRKSLLKRGRHDVLDFVTQLKRKSKQSRLKQQQQTQQHDHPPSYHSSGCQHTTQQTPINYSANNNDQVPNQAESIHNSSSSSSSSNIGSSSGLGNSSNNSGAISLHNSTGGMGNIITNNGIVSNYGLEQQKRFFEEKLIQQQNEFQEKLVQQEIEFQKALNEQCNHLKRKVEELETLESTAKKKCTELENRIAIQKKKVKERIANIWPDEDDADDDDPKSFILRGISHTLTDQQVTDFKVCSQFGVAIERLMAIAKITAINESDFSDLEKALLILTNVETPRTAKKRKKRFQNLKNRYSHLFQEEGARCNIVLGCDNGGSSSSSGNVGTQE
ncbi:predicted protein [Naegleria gruberi]|uniref:Predicted protein n=1 Tax=Naegleria gruberi TaxID=5762 RepID=D2VCU8_NAEGR|nr:uncharacterized protein NAEGRDRAFT_66698 [Naegleria gruberi]EFC45483.1 predicted protein [Naegleria gruberi]|eukprot:XP_002678227.1 predicted protein [Naegleria gruberi strain NEG-M]